MCDVVTLLMVGLLDVARRTYTEVVDDIAGQLVYNCTYSTIPLDIYHIVHHMWPISYHWIYHIVHHMWSIS